jgi:hypothetical protein
MVDEQESTPETTHAAEDFEEMFHNYAQEQDKKDQGQSVGGDPQEQLKAQVVQVLLTLKAQVPVLEQLKQSAPDTYEAVMALAQAVIAMAKQLNGDSAHQNDEEADDQPQGQATAEDSSSSENKEESSGVDPSAKEDVAQKAEAFQNDLEKAQKEDRKDSKQKSDSPDNATAIDDKQDEPERHDCDDFGHVWGVDTAGEYCLFCGKFSDEPDEEVEKATLQPGARGAEPSHHHVILPVGSKIDPGPHAQRRTAGRIKVQHSDGKQSWIQARAGQVMSQDGHPISARNPEGK